MPNTWHFRVPYNLHNCNKHPLQNYEYVQRLWERTYKGDAFACRGVERKIAQISEPPCYTNLPVYSLSGPLPFWSWTSGVRKQNRTKQTGGSIPFCSRLFPFCGVNPVTNGKASLFLPRPQSPHFLLQTDPLLLGEATAAAAVSLGCIMKWAKKSCRTFHVVCEQKCGM